MNETSETAPYVEPTKSPYGNVILIILLLVTLFLIYKMYQSPLDSKSYLTMIYLYITFGLLFIAFVSNYLQFSSITGRNSALMMIILYFVLVIGGMCLMFFGGFLTTHIGFLIMLVGLSLIIGSVFRYSTNVASAALITAIIMGVLTFIVFMSSTETLAKMQGWSNVLVWILLAIIIIQIIFMFVGGGLSQKAYSILNILIIILFVFFILSDTSRVLLKSQNLTCSTQNCVNYPLESTGLILDYVNIFIRLLSGNR